MSDFPFQLKIKRPYPEKRTECLLCTDLLRIIPGKRQVYTGVWNNRGVIAKVFSDKYSAKRHLRREWRGLNNLAGRKINTPEPLFYGQTEKGEWVIVMEKIADSSTALEMFENLPDPSEKLDLLILVGRELAQQHIRGVLQKDLHLGNYLLKDDKVFALDAGQMRFLHGELGRKKSIAQLAMLAAWLHDSGNQAVGRLCEEYFKVRDWNFGKPDEISVKKELNSHLKRAINRGLKKSLRTSKKYLRITDTQNIAVFDRDFCNEDDARDFIGQVDMLMDAGEILKNGRTCYVSRLSRNSRDVVVKRYNHKGLIHSLRHTIKGTRARACWIHGHRLGMLNIATPKPLAYIERREGLLIWNSYLVTEYVEGSKLYDFLRDESVTEKQRLGVIQQIKETLAKMGKFRITHGDLKHTNILITKDGPVLTDLDAMRVHKWYWSYRIRRAKDLGRFDWEKSVNNLLMGSNV